eukprot:TRINITY_DN18269_c0_g1_i1.p1 TRINITY_DN18269_c0_g1~~TRINITY_DN18269_c0_g1_i1.p1  ORF type:complete len:821 (-),score=117.29 TRINITY_DN18269_c0_g1_i1:268-2730(-)
MFGFMGAGFVPGSFMGTGMPMAPPINSGLASQWAAVAAMSDVMRATQQAHMDEERERERDKVRAEAEEKSTDIGFDKDAVMRLAEEAQQRAESERMEAERKAAELAQVACMDAERKAAEQAQLVAEQSALEQALVAEHERTECENGVCEAAEHRARAEAEADEQAACAEDARIRQEAEDVETAASVKKQTANWSPRPSSGSKSRSRSRSRSCKKGRSRSKRYKRSRERSSSRSRKRSRSRSRSRSSSRSHRRSRSRRGRRSTSKRRRKRSCSKRSRSRRRNSRSRSWSRKRTTSCSRSRQRKSRKRSRSKAGRIGRKPPRERVLSPPRVDGRHVGSIPSASSSSIGQKADTAEVPTRRSKWDIQAPALVPKPDVPTWMQEAKDLGYGTIRQKVIRMQAVQIRCMLGVRGDTINWICNRSGADIKVKHVRGEVWGNVSIVGNIEKTLDIIREVLTAKGCPLTEIHDDVPKPFCPPTPVPTSDAAAMQHSIDLPQELVGSFIGIGGANIKDIKAKVGGPLSIKVLSPDNPCNPHKIQVAGDNVHFARDLVRAKIEEVRQAYLQLVAEKAKAKGQGKDARMPLLNVGQGRGALGDAGICEGFVGNSADSDGQGTISQPPPPPPPSTPHPQHVAHGLVSACIHSVSGGGASSDFGTGPCGCGGSLYGGWSSGSASSGVALQCGGAARPNPRLASFPTWGNAATSSSCGVGGDSSSSCTAAQNSMSRAWGCPGGFMVGSQGNIGANVASTMGAAQGTWGGAVASCTQGFAQSGGQLEPYMGCGCSGVTSWNGCSSIGSLNGCANRGNGPVVTIAGCSSSGGAAQG